MYFELLIRPTTGYVPHNPPSCCITPYLPTCLLFPIQCRRTGLETHLRHHPRTLAAASPLTAPCNGVEQFLVLHPHTPFQGGWDFEPSLASCSHLIHLIDEKPHVLILGPMGLHRMGSVRLDQRTPVSCQIQNLIQMPWGRVLVRCLIFPKFGECKPPCQKNSAQVLQSAPRELGSGAANRSVNPELICPPYILWTRRVRAGSDPSSLDPRPVVAQAQPSSPDQHPSLPARDPSSPDLNRTRPTLHPSLPEFFLSFLPVVARTVILVPVVARCVLTVARCTPVVVHCGPVVGHCEPVVARCISIVARCGPVVERCATRHRDPSCARPALVRASLISTRAFS